jgi:exodeoxyribonuclease VII small subunit
MSKSKQSFEQQLEELEGIVNAMEQGELSLEDALKQFEQGVKLTKSCQSLLDNARQKIKILTEQQELSDFQIDEDAAEYTDHNS